MLNLNVLVFIIVLRHLCIVPVPVPPDLIDGWVVHYGENAVQEADNVHDKHLGEEVDEMDAGCGVGEGEFEIGVGKDVVAD